MRVTINPPPENFEVTLAMTLRDIAVLKFIMSRIGGNPDGPRGVAKSIQRALDNIKTTTPDRRITEPPQGKKKGIWLPDEWDAFEQKEKR